jgi:Domain of unknown function (DUF4397)
MLCVLRSARIATALAGLVACGGSPASTVDGGETAEASTLDVSSDAGDAGDSATDAGAPDDGLRLANMSEDTSAVDVCIAASTGTYTSPYFTSNGLAGGVVSQRVSAYAPLAPGSYKVRLVAPTTGCSSPLANDATVDLMMGSYVTVLVTDAASDGGVNLSTFSDEHGPTSHIHFRLLNASAHVDAPSVDLATTLIYEDAPLAALPVAAPDAGADNLAFLDSDPLPVQNGPDGLPLSLRGVGWPIAVRVRVMPLAAGDVVSLFVYGAPAGLGSLEATQTVIACKDLVASSGETSCAAYVN